MNLDLLNVARVFLRVFLVIAVAMGIWATAILSVDSIRHCRRTKHGHINKKTPVCPKE